jgi:hypothetical protein
VQHLSVYLRHAIAAALLTLVSTKTWSQTSDDSASIRIHLLGHAIGSERYVIRRDGDARVLVDTFAFTDRSGRTQLVSSFRFTPKFEPLHLRSAGRTYRFVNVDAEVTIANGHCQRPPKR